MSGAATAFLVAIAAAVFAGIAFKAYRDRRPEVVARESTRLAVLRSLNDSIAFAEVSDIELHRVLENKQDFDRFDPRAYLLLDIDGNEDRYRSWVEGAKHNRLQLERYKQELERMPASTYSRASWRRIEDELLEQELLRPTTAPSVVVRWEYTSPAGRNRYGDVREFKFNDVIRLLNEAVELREQRSTRQAAIQRERSLMTSGLRYDVMKRDGFRCVLCGSSASDGVNLEVDHIVPVSRGGKTEMSNLRTLCDRCNQGKRDKV